MYYVCRIAFRKSIRPGIKYMKPQLLKVPAQHEQSFSVRLDSVPYFYNYWHYHPEIELIGIRQGRGTQFIGDHISHFREGDVLLVGAGLPHLWRCEEAYHQGLADLRAEAIVVHFLPDFWGAGFLELPELLAVKELLRRAARGIRITGRTGREVMQQLEELLRLQGAPRIAHLIALLHRVASAPDAERVPLSLGDFKTTFDKTDHHRLNLIYTFTLTHYPREIQLQEVAALVSMSRLAFCRYFKAKTGKTYTQFLMELRIGRACKLLIENALSVSQVALECGYNNYSNFNRQFNRIAGMTPLTYRKKYVQ